MPYFLSNGRLVLFCPRIYISTFVCWFDPIVSLFCRRMWQHSSSVSKWTTSLTCRYPSDLTNAKVWSMWWRRVCISKTKVCWRLDILPRDFLTDRLKYYIWSGIIRVCIWTRISGFALNQILCHLFARGKNNSHIRWVSRHHLEPLIQSIHILANAIFLPVFYPQCLAEHQSVTCTIFILSSDTHLNITLQIRSILLVFGTFRRS